MLDGKMATVENDGPLSIQDPGDAKDIKYAG